jgi:hypothetical protein
MMQLSSNLNKLIDITSMAVASGKVTPQQAKYFNAIQWKLSNTLESSFDQVLLTDIAKSTMYINGDTRHSYSFDFAALQTLKLNEINTKGDILQVINGINADILIVKQWLPDWQLRQLNNQKTSPIISFSNFHATFSSPEILNQLYKLKTDILSNLVEARYLAELASNASTENFGEAVNKFKRQQYSLNSLNYSRLDKVHIFNDPKAKINFSDDKNKKYTINFPQLTEDNFPIFQLDLGVANNEDADFRKLFATMQLLEIMETSIRVWLFTGTYPEISMANTDNKTALLEKLKLYNI